MKVLVLGGTAFLGRHIVEAALVRGHDVTLFNRGRHNPLPVSAVENLRGDRDGDLSALDGRTFDLVIDTSAYRPEQVEATARTLATTDHYILISTISVYERFPPGVSVDEQMPVTAGHEGYGALKARCEEALHATFAGAASCIRPGLIVGPYDPTNRFAYWPRRIARGGEVLAPGRPERRIQFIDVRDVADWCLRLGERRQSGTYNAVGPQGRLTMGDFLDACRQAIENDSRLTWVADEFLTAAGVEPWTELPLWIPESDTQFGGMLNTDNRRALSAGLTFRTVAETVRATLEWDRREGALRSDSSIPIGPLTAERERDALRAAATRSASLNRFAATDQTP